MVGMKLYAEVVRIIAPALVLDHVQEAVVADVLAVQEGVLLHVLRVVREDVLEHAQEVAQEVVLAHVLEDALVHVQMLALIVVPGNVSSAAKEVAHRVVMALVPLRATDGTIINL